MAVQRQVMRRCARVKRCALVHQKLNIVPHRLREMHQAGRPMAVIDVLIPLVTKNAPHQNLFLARSEARDGRVPPEAVPPILRRHLERVVPPRVDREYRPRQRVFRLRAERIDRSAVSERASPLALDRVELD